ncbi:MAG: T9SS type A sorting domain-containing protein [Salinivirgaceae bacterium]|jgi:hypothetical protein|nr:T9SS type A sorting domain-containing protein [Salinivirgaceae bacterium]
MKKFTLLTLAIACLQIVSFHGFSQINYHGVSGNMISGDFDNDGLKDDIAAFNTSGDLPVLQLWTSDNGWVNEQEAKCRLPFDYLEAKSLNSKIVSGDFDNDGFHDDIAAIYEIELNKTCITVWTYNDGEFIPQRWWFGGDFDASQVGQTIVAGDFDRDGFIDDIAAFYDYEQKRTKVFVWKSDGNKFTWPGTWWVGNDFNSTRIQGTMVAGDFNHDGYHDDIAALYNYIDDYTKIFVWTTNKNKFNWPYTWFAMENFAAGKAKNNVIAGDFNNNGFVDNIAALYSNDEYASSILVFERNNRGFNQPDIWWYGNDEANTHRMRLVSADFNSNNLNDQITGLSIIDNDASLATWTAENRSFTLPEKSWEDITLDIEDCNENGGCLSSIKTGDFNLYPNPNKGKFTIDVPKAKDDNLNIVVYNVLGSQVLNLKAKPGIALAIELQEFKSGTYMLIITGRDFTMNESFVVE